MTLKPSGRPEEDGDRLGRIKAWLDDKNVPYEELKYGAITVDYETLKNMDEGLQRDVFEEPMVYIEVDTEGGSMGVRKEDWEKIRNLRVTYIEPARDLGINGEYAVLDYLEGRELSLRGLSMPRFLEDDVEDELVRDMVKMKLFQGLEELDLCDSEIGDVAAGLLCSRLKNLKRLDLSGNKISEEVQEFLKKKLEDRGGEVSF